jgi:hypothetical protein
VKAVEQSPAGVRVRSRLVLLSFLMLFVELALIRWTGSNIVYLSYFSNFVLLGSFLGIGVGFLRARAPRNLYVWAPACLTLLVIFVESFTVEIDRSGSELIYFGSTRSTGFPTWVTLPIVFLAVAAVMEMIAEGVARTFVQLPPLQAYRLDIVGSIAGIVAFTTLSLLRAPPYGWGAVTAGLFVLLSWPRVTPLLVVASLGMMGFLVHESLAPTDSWSPYYRITVRELLPGEFIIDVNGIPHQTISSVERRQRLEEVYFLPYERARSHSFDRVLIVGAGNGTDVAIALANGAGHVDAVEIDPRLYEIGRELHPDRPYSDSRVEVHIEDGRAFLERTRRRYDLILFALPDSLTLVSGQSSLRLESYLFTIEAMRRARARLVPGGVFAMYNYYREDWLVDRLAGTLERAYGHRPCLDSVGARGRLALLSIGNSADGIECPTPWRPTTSFVPPPARDDYPFLYLKRRIVPGFYLITIALIAAASVLLVRAGAGPFRRMAGFTDLFFMGAAFLLLETKNVVQFALLFGTTWLVNALVFAGILVSVLAAVEVARHVRFRRPARLYGALLAALAIAWATPGGALLRLPFPARFGLAVIIAFTPIFLANLVFAQRFAGVGSSSVAFGANLLGAMAGGILEYAALVVGYRSLLIVVAALYGLAFATGFRQLRATAAAT